MDPFFFDGFVSGVASIYRYPMCQCGSQSRLKTYISGLVYLKINATEEKKNIVSSPKSRDFL